MTSNSEPEIIKEVEIRTVVEEKEDSNAVSYIAIGMAGTLIVVIFVLAIGYLIVKNKRQSQTV